MMTDETGFRGPATSGSSKTSAAANFDIIVTEALDRLSRDRENIAGPITDPCRRFISPAFKPQ